MSALWPRIVAHVDMDAFFAAVEQRDDPTARGVPVIVGRATPRGVVATASYEARRFGVRSAMPMVQALRLCPHARVLPPRMAHYAAISRAILAALERFSPVVEPVSIDEAFLDLTGAVHLHGGIDATVAAIKQAVAAASGGLTASVGVAPTKFAAKIASDLHKPDGTTIVSPDDLPAFLARQPVTAIWGVGPVTARTLHAMGLRTMGDVARSDPRTLESRLGAACRHIHQLCRGVDPRPVAPREERHSIGKEVTLETDVQGAPAIAAVLERCADAVARTLRRRDQYAAKVRIKLKTADFRLITRQTALPEPTQTARGLYATAVHLLRHCDVHHRYRLVGLAAFDLSAAPRQLALFSDRREETARKVERTVDAVRQRFGPDALVRADWLETDSDEAVFPPPQPK